MFKIKKKGKKRAVANTRATSTSTNPDRKRDVGGFRQKRTNPTPLADNDSIHRKNHSEAKNNPKKKSRNSNNPIFTRIFAAILFTMFLFYLAGYFVVMFNRQTTAATVVLNGSVDFPVSIEGVIIRDEDVYTAPEDGEIKYLVNDLEKIKVNTVVATMQNAEAVSDIQDNLKNIDQELLALQNLRDDFSLTQKDARRLNSQMKAAVEDKMFDFSVNKVRSLYDVKENITSKMNIRNKLILEENRGSLVGLSESRADVMKQLGENERAVVVKESGIISYYLDSYEEVYTLKTAKSLTKELVNNKIKETDFVTTRNVNKGDKIFKMIKSNEWYIGCYVNNQLADHWKEGDAQKIFVQKDLQDQPLLVYVDKIVPYDKESYVLLKATKNMVDYMNQRKITFKTAESEEIGLKIPNSAIAEMTILKIPVAFLTGEDHNFVCRRNLDGTNENVLVTVWTTEGDIAWVIQKYSLIGYGDTIVRPDKQSEQYVVNEDQNLFGVYRTNSGVARFVEITVHAIPKDFTGFTILDPKTNATLKAYDSIVTDVSNIEEGQRVYRK